MSKVISREYRIYLALWRKALNSAEPIVINCPSRAMSYSMRQGMYRAIRPFRNGEMNDQELMTAAEKFVVFINKETNALELRNRMTLLALEDMFDALGIDEEDLKLGDERAADISLAKLLNNEDVQPVRKTAFYVREADGSVD